MIFSDPATVAHAHRAASQGRRDVIGCPVMPRAGRCVRVIAENDEAAGAGRCIAPAQGRGQVVAITGEAIAEPLANALEFRRILRLQRS
jgi:hypothetical protein